ncbi:HisA/HisF-related TIM barrel protein [Daejeonella sp.]|nr:HisA/HisF-related TIM barrel protein [Daejeonella sp.]HQT24832.1 HisA/HisF-related TIM barrel protein [Daejeonella sp.]
MYLPRVIPCLLLDEQRLVKTQKFASPSYVGDPINAVKIFNELEVDELILLDIQASKKNTEPDYEHISEIVSEAFMPVAVGGGIKNIDQAAKLINIGVEKIIVNTGAHKSFQVITDISQRFGSQSAVLAIDIKKTFLAGYKIYDHTTKKTLPIDTLTFIQNGIRSGAGEIFVNFVDNDGLGGGYNYDVITYISQNIEVPLVVCG